MTPDWVPPSTRIAPAEPARTAPRSSRRPSRRPRPGRGTSPADHQQDRAGPLQPESLNQLRSSEPRSCKRGTRRPDAGELDVDGLDRPVVPLGSHGASLHGQDRAAACPHTRMCRLGARPAHCHKRGKSPSATSTRGPSCAVAAIEPAHAGRWNSSRYANPSRSLDEPRIPRLPPGAPDERINLHQAAKEVGIGPRMP